MIRPAQYSFIVINIFMLISCIQDDCEKCRDNTAPSNKLCITFAGSNADVKSVSMFSPNVMASVFTYNSGDNPQSKESYSGTPFTVISDSSGNLIPISKTNFFLPPGYYDFYSVSVNQSESEGPEFTKGESKPLNNGVDYLWAASEDVKVFENQVIIFNYKRCAVAIEIEIGKNNESIFADSLLIRQPTESSYMNLGTGIISFSNSLEHTYTPMYLEHNRATSIILPLIKGVDIPVLMKRDNKIYRCTIPSPEHGFEGGVIYKYKAVIGENAAKIVAASVNPWIYKPVITIEINE